MTFARAASLAQLVLALGPSPRPWWALNRCAIVVQLLCNCFILVVATALVKTGWQTMQRAHLQVDALKKKSTRWYWAQRARDRRKDILSTTARWNYVYALNNDVGQTTSSVHVTDVTKKIVENNWCALRCSVNCLRWFKFVGLRLV